MSTAVTAPTEREQARSLSFGIDDITRMLPHRWPMLMIDRAFDVVPGGDTGDTVRAAIGWDLRASEMRAEGLYGRDGGVLLPYLGRGSGGLAVAASLTGVEFDSTGVAALRGATATPIVAMGGMFEGRSGLVVAAHAISHGTHPFLPEMRRRLAWSVVRREEDVLFRGDQNVRCTMDFATGSAGAVIALQADPVAAFARMCGFAV